jgi:catechol 2,3-dioxygenase-like lactoylglutathione lyase family enzyme
MTSLDHCVIAVSDWERSNEFYAAVLGAEAVRVGAGYTYRFGANQLNVHGPGVDGEPNARPPVTPGGADLCFVWPAPIEDAVAHLERLGVEVEFGPGVALRRTGRRHERLLPRPRRVTARVHLVHVAEEVNDV